MEFSMYASVNYFRVFTAFETPYTIIIYTCSFVCLFTLCAKERQGEMLLLNELQSPWKYSVKDRPINGFRVRRLNFWTNENPCFSLGVKYVQFGPRSCHVCASILCSTFFFIEVNVMKYLRITKISENDGKIIFEKM